LSLLATINELNYAGKHIVVTVLDLDIGNFDYLRMMYAKLLSVFIFRIFSIIFSIENCDLTLTNQKVRYG